MTCACADRHEIPRYCCCCMLKRCSCKCLVQDTLSHTYLERNIKQMKNYFQKEQCENNVIYYCSTFNARSLEKQEEQPSKYRNWQNKQELELMLFLLFISKALPLLLLFILFVPYSPVFHFSSAHPHRIVTVFIPHCLLVVLLFHWINLHQFFLFSFIFFSYCVFFRNIFCVCLNHFCINNCKKFQVG